MNLAAETCPAPAREFEAMTRLRLARWQVRKYNRYDTDVEEPPFRTFVRRLANAQKFEEAERPKFCTGTFSNQRFHEWVTHTPKKGLFP
jgi:hypothetical protein